MRAAQRRGVQSRMLRSEDIPVLFLGYQRGAFAESIRETPKLAEYVGNDVDQFSSFMGAMGEIGELWVTVARSHQFPKRDRVPIGFWFVQLWMPHLIIPHVTWMPWATPRQKLEGMLGFFVQQRASREIGVFGETHFNNFWRRLAQYGVFARVGTWPAYFPNGDTAEVWRVI